MWKITPILLGVAVSGCTDDCGNSIIRRSDAPGGEHVAVMFEESCGATTPFWTEISILRAGEKFVGDGNTFSADADHGRAAVGDWGGPWAEMRWLAPDHLLVRYATGSQVFVKNERVLGVKVSYQTVAAAQPFSGQQPTVRSRRPA